MTKIRCRGCGVCNDRSYCGLWRDKKLPSYSASAIRYTADGFDCALPVSIDTYNTCSYRCQYCFSNYLIRDPQRKGDFTVRALGARQLEGYLSGERRIGASETYIGVLDEVGGEDTPRCPVQWGALGDPFDCIERQHGRSLELMGVFEKYNQAVRISTKGGTVVSDKVYQEAFARRPELWWVAWSLISCDDGVLERVDKDAPNATQRLKAMTMLSKLGIKNSLRFRPALPGISDRTPGEPKAWRTLLRKAADAGVVSVSFEVAFVPGAMPGHVRRMWNEIEKVVGFDISGWYKKTSKYGSCLRSSRAWKEDITFAVYEETKKLGMNFGISDPHWKELNDFGCCCGIPPDDPMFGGWMRKNATNALVRARDTGRRISARDGIPAWAEKVPMQDLVVMTGPQNIYRRATKTWADKLRDTWNDVSGARGPLHYFEGALMPVGRTKSGDVLYEYAKVERQRLENPHWVV